MKKRWFFLLAFLILSVSTVAYDAACTFVEHGTMHAGKEPGCWMFVGDDGKIFQPIGGSDVFYSDGLSGFLVGTLTQDISGYCEAGNQVLVCRFEVDAQVILVGTVDYIRGPNGGCWTLSAGHDTYEPRATSRSFYRVGIRVRVRCVVRPDLSTQCALGPVAEVLDYDIITQGDDGPGTPSSPHCQAAYTRCLQACGENACYASCETLRQACNDPH